MSEDRIDIAEGKPSEAQREQLRQALDRARNHKMTPQEVFEQRVSFIYGQMPKAATATREDVRLNLLATHGWPAEASERAAIVAWLRDRAEWAGAASKSVEESALCRAAALIEQGEHLK